MVEDATKDRTPMCHLRRIGEASFPHEGENRLSRVIPHVLASVKQMSEETVRTLVCPAKIKHMQGTPWSQHTPYLVQGLLLLILLEVVEHEG